MATDASTSSGDAAGEIADAAIGAAEAGAALVHLHSRNPKNGRTINAPKRSRRFSRQSSSAPTS